MPPKKETTPIEIIRPEMVTLTVPVIGTSMLVTHAWSEKAKEMLRRQGEKAVRKKREPRKPDEDFRASLYQSTAGWYGVPALSFKSAAVGACRFIEGLPMNHARMTLFVLPDGYNERGDALVKIDGDGPHMREDIARVGMGQADLRYRGYWREWGAMVQVQINKNIISEDQVVNLFAIAGSHCGVCEGRPSAPKSTMDWGRFRIASADEFEQVEEEP